MCSGAGAGAVRPVSLRWGGAGRGPHPGQAAGEAAGERGAGPHAAGGRPRPGGPGGPGGLWVRNPDYRMFLCTDVSCADFQNA